MRLLITGGAGFIGSHLCDMLMEKGHEVICIDNFATGTPQNLLQLEGRPGFSLVRQDVTEHLDVEGPLDYVLHFASPASPVDYMNLPIQTLKVGALGTHKALGVAKAKGARFLLASTSEVYGDPEVNPQPEGYWGHVNPIGPRSVYDEAKRFAEALTMAYHRIHGIDTRISRIFNTYGPRMRLKDGRVIPNFIMQALSQQPISVFGDGSQTRSFSYISDMVAGIYALMGADYHLPVNLGNPQEMTVLELARRVRDLTGSSSSIVFRPLPQDDPQRRKPDIGRARELLGWEPKVGLEEGLTKTIAWFRTVMT
ncbi:MAG: SDR family oxidoreductase [Chloroflexi bacterium]|nr:SDR family oxidoreductase [Chloroflexota bacterium]